MAGVPEKDRALLRTGIYESLKLRLGLLLMQRLDSSQLKELEQLEQNADQSPYFAFIDKLLPDADDVISKILDKMKREITEYPD